MNTRNIVMLVVASLCGLFATAQTVHKKTTHTKTAPAGLSAAIANGKKIYVAQCLSCHQADGAGVPRMNPPLIKTTYVLGDKATMIKIVLNGFKEDVEINGETYSNIMPPRDAMKDQEIADVLTFVRKSFGNKASAVSVTDVRKVRAANKKPAATI